MSTISDVFDIMKAGLINTLPSHTWMYNPKEVGEHDDLTLNQGVGIYFGPMEKIDREIDNHMWFRRRLNVVITRRHFASEMNFEQKEETNKQLLEEQLLVVRFFMNDPLESLTKSVSKAIFIGDSGIEKFVDGNGSFLKIDSEFQIDYRELIQI